ncbi:MAG: hypothetical protein AYK19_08985 [Theionarchaea archaeon DG-70-1]|nr:MAG: hypothetical protein AYK19_08985 [Theionarchaea archaeon DG-70-1]
MDNNKKRKKIETGGILFALFVLLLGAFALLFNVSIFTGLFRLLSFWPLLVVGLGVYLIFKNMDHERIGVVVLAVLLVAAMYTAFSQVQRLPESLDEKAVPPGITEMDVSLDLLFGTFSVDSTSDALYIYKGYQPMKFSMDTIGDTAKLSFSLEEEAFIPFRWSSNEYEILLNQYLPISMIVDTALSSCSFDFSNLNVEEFILDGGVSSAEIVFGETNTTAVFSMGVSSVTIYVPESVGVRIVSDGLMSLSVPPDWLKTDNVYESPNYDTAVYKINITLDIGMGSVTIAYV